MILIISIVHVQVLIPGQGDAEFNSLKRDQKPRLLYRQLGDPEKLETISQTSSVNPVKALSCEILSIYCVEKNLDNNISTHCVCLVCHLRHLRIRTTVKHQYYTTSSKHYTLHTQKFRFERED